ncbi:hypothetical protein FN846DRAFT_816425 [Sphaerosporella brunnea]|uniref:DUF7907 domain-containing protein n=1 Tax=Sphaerosporella brunnea TaxID=1250544 RepID=A0A5J5EMR4_9PEZI|nr:hypothetical protein FN846DRAFT_816425 [Sphaerosporella brunnea]
MGFFHLSTFVAAGLLLFSQLASAQQKFYLRSQATDGGPSRFSNLYPSSYHTGAGMSILALTPDRKGSIKSYLKDTRMMADLGTSFPWGWMHGSEGGYGSWAPMNLVAGGGDEGFEIDKYTGGGVRWEGNEWVACDWAYGVTQLFYYAHGHYTPLPCSCAKIKLVPEYNL